MVANEAGLDGFGVRNPVLPIASHRQLGQNISLVFCSVYSSFRDFVDRLLRHIGSRLLKKKRIGVKSMRMLITVLFAATLSLFMGCASAPTGQPSGLRLYTFDDSGTGLIRAFRHENTTVLQFVNLEGEHFVILDGEGHQLKYERVGEHYVILPGTYGSLTVRMFSRNASVKITGAVEEREPFDHTDIRKAPAVVHQEPKTSIPAAEPARQKAAVQSAAPAPEPAVAPVCSAQTETLAGNCVSSGLTGYVVQVWSCTDKPTAEKLKGGLESKGYAVEIKVRSHPKTGAVYGVRLHPMGAVDAWEAMKRIRHELGVKPKLMEIPPDQLAAYEAGQ